MTIEIKVPALGESVTEATLSKWYKNAGDPVKADEPICELETDKVTVEVPAPATGVMGEHKIGAGSTVAVGTVIGTLKPGAAGASVAAAAPAAVSPPKPAATPAAPPPAAPSAMPPSPAARKILEEKGVASADVAGTGRRGQVMKSDAMAATAAPAPQPAAASLPVTR
ncbi:MAG TPA: E3 binding domain-containing protein, partial [Hyphomicrobiaceae bacterium]|nr:E3 binding domain-containing protein [Hyphomicrobiaceae bacterium]